MNAALFDDRARRLRSERALRIAGDRFLHARAFDDCLDRLADVRGTFRTACFAGSADPRWPPALAAMAPGMVVDDSGEYGPESFDLCVSIGGLESTNDVQAAAFALRHILRPGGLLIGAIVGGNSLPRLRAAMLAADRVDGAAAPHLHPSMDGPSLAALLSSVGFVEPVIDVDRVDVRYLSLDRLVGDLRAMGCTNILAERSKRSIGRNGLDAARSAFLDGETHALERFELLHFTAWAPGNETGQVRA